jgi:hypothetical protein
MDPLPGIAVDIPANVQRGEAARLFPVLSENSREGRAASVLLATLSVVDAFADALLRRLGRPIGKRAKVRCFTEIVLKSDPHFRPDGLLVVDTGQSNWSALIECKIGRATIETEQLENYLRKARENGIDAVITISNQLVADPSRPPTEITGHLTRSVGHFHYSWLAIRSEAEIAFSQALVADPEKNFILAELIRFLSHPSAGVEGFGEMPPVWPEVINEIGAGRLPRRSDSRIVELASAWLQEEKELTLILSRLVSRRCFSRTEKRLRRGDYDPVASIASELADTRCLVTEFYVPDTAAEIVVTADLKSRSTRVSMTLTAPEDRKRPEARLNWFLNQLKAADAKGVEIVAHWPGRAKSTYGSLESVREDPTLITQNEKGMSPSYFEVIQACHTPASFSGRRRFHGDLEAAVQQFYLNIGSRLAAWAPKAPSPAERTVAEQIVENSTIEPQLSAVHESLADVMKSFGVAHSEPQAPPTGDDGEAKS